VRCPRELAAQCRVAWEAAAAAARSTFSVVALAFRAKRKLRAASGAVWLGGPGVAEGRAVHR
jgi:hypothetical protein